MFLKTFHYRNDLPTMGKMRAIDLWFLVCFGTSVAALVETVVVVTYCVKYRIERVDESLENDKEDVRKICRRIKTGETAYKVILILFLLTFNTFFWLYYLLVEK
ncbi:Uncharacterised protein r2_g4254 [Pycnogonum litorale]